MYRTRGTMLGVVAAVAAAGLLAGCGDEESTATSTPTLSTPAAASSSESSAPAPAPAPGEQPPAPEAPAPEESAAPEAPPEEMERPAPVEPQETAAAELGPKEQTYIDELAKQGVTPSTPDIALSIGSYVCSQAAQGTPDPAMLTWVTAMAGADAAFDPAKMPVEQAGQIYINTAKAHYC
ncbi:DUF732 domain-containing protein [Nocardia carnea]|uniref:DUF732 domain-containing protein n=1 Tax=Nocardia carnea TaxID=37328 RepID=UPI00245782E6|nr:DUF732 domain-containing protein [Nocardia carnea]